MFWSISSLAVVWYIVQYFARIFFSGEVVVVRVEVVLLLTKMEDCRNWNEKEYRASIVAERDVHSRIIFAAAFVPASGTCCHSFQQRKRGPVPCATVRFLLTSAETGRKRASMSRHSKAFDDCLETRRSCIWLVELDHNASLLSCGDDGRIQGWRGKEIFMQPSVVRPHQVRKDSEMLYL
jgi:hypothetical protein